MWWTWAGRRRARRAGDGAGHACAGRRLAGLAHRPLSAQVLRIEVARQRRPFLKDERRAHRVLRIRNAAATTSQGVTAEIPVGLMTCVTGVSGFGQVHADQRHALRRRLAPALPEPPGPGAARSRAWATSTRSSTSTRARSGARRAPTRRPTPAIFTPIRELFAEVPTAASAATAPGASASTSRAGAARRPARRRRHQGGDALPARCLRALRRPAWASATTARRWRCSTNIAEVLDMTVEAREFFSAVPSIRASCRR